MNSKVDIVQDNTITVKKFRAQGRKVEFKVKPTPSGEDPTSWFKQSIEEVVRFTTENLKPTDKVGIIFHGKSFNERGPGWMSFRNADKVLMEDIWEMISKIFQSNSEGMSIYLFCFLLLL